MLTFQVDGLKNSKIQSLKFPGFAISCGRFLDDKSFILGSGHQPCFYTYDMEVGKETKYPCNFTQNKRNTWMAKVSCEWGVEYLHALYSFSLQDKQSAGA